MAEQQKALKKELTLIDIYAIATGTTLSAGFFLLPGMAAAQAGPAVILSYLLAAIPLIPAMFCMMELCTAMPRAGGAYYFLDRSMGPLIGTIGGLGTWLSIVLKTAFALIGMGAYISLFISGGFIKPLAIILAVAFGWLNLGSAKESGKIQFYMVIAIIGLLAGFIGHGFFKIDYSHFNNFFTAGTESIFATAGLVYISYAGITKVTSVAEEVKNPERNLPLGMFLSFITAIVIYGLGTYIMVGVVPMDEFKTSLTPVALAAEYMVGNWGKILVTVAALFGFSSITNAGILSSSRFPLAMSRDHLLPRMFRKLNKQNVPVWGVAVTVGAIIAIIIFLNPLKIAKLASSFQLLMFALICLAVIIMRESHIEAYDPSFRTPMYPWMPIFGIFLPLEMIREMGAMPILFSVVLILLAIFWYFYYARQRVQRGGAILHVFERWGRRRHEGLEYELRGILKEKGLREDDPFNEMVTRCQFIDLEKSLGFDELIARASGILGETVSFPQAKIEQELIESTRVGGTPVSHGVALPHLRLHHLVEPEILIFRSKIGIKIDMPDGFWGDHAPVDKIHAAFFLVSPEENPRQHLRILAKLAGRVEEGDFMNEWLEADNEQEIKEILLHEEHFMSVRLKPDKNIGTLIGKRLRDFKMPKGSLVAMIHRDGSTVVPDGNTVLKKGDRITIIGDRKGIKEFRKQYL